MTLCHPEVLLPSSPPDRSVPRRCGSRPCLAPLLLHAFRTCTVPKPQNLFPTPSSPPRTSAGHSKPVCDLLRTKDPSAFRSTEIHRPAFVTLPANTHIISHGTFPVPSPPFPEDRCAWRMAHCEICERRDPRPPQPPRSLFVHIPVLCFAGSPPPPPVIYTPSPARRMARCLSE